jgi:hypothetical protein
MNKVQGANGDRLNLDPWNNGNQLVQAVAAVNKKTIVVIHSVGPIILETIVALPNVVAIVWAGLPGQESGNALVDVLYGSTAPSGKLPYTIGKSQSDYGTSIASHPATNSVLGFHTPHLLILVWHYQVSAQLQEAARLSQAEFRVSTT